MAEDVDSEALAVLVVNKLRGGLKVAAVKAPGFGDNRKAILQDLAVLTGSEIISEDTGEKLEDMQLSQLGSAKTVPLQKTTRFCWTALETRPPSRPVAKLYGTPSRRRPRN